MSQPRKVLHENTFEYLKPTDRQLALMQMYRAAGAHYGQLLEQLPDGPDKTFILRSYRSMQMWINVCLTREADGTPRTDLLPDGAGRTG